MEAKKYLELYLYDDLAKLVMDFTYEKCNNCKCHTESPKLIYDYKMRHICNMCFESVFFTMCSHCKYCFQVSDSRWCASCEDNCVIFCPECYEGRSIMFFMM